VEEMTIVDRVVVDVENLSRLDDHAAVPPAEPLLVRTGSAGSHLAQEMEEGVGERGGVFEHPQVRGIFDDPHPRVG